MPFIEDVHVRLQAWGANYDSDNFLDIENDLRGTSRKLKSDGSHHQLKYRSSAAANSYPVMEPFVKESRISQPAWMLRDQDAEYSRWEQPWLDPQAHTEKSFESEVNTRRQARDMLS